MSVKAPLIPHGFMRTRCALRQHGKAEVRSVLAELLTDFCFYVRAVGGRARS